LVKTPVGVSCDESEGGKNVQETLKGYIEGKDQLEVPRGRWSDALDKDVQRMLKCSN